MVKRLEVGRLEGEREGCVAASSGVTSGSYEVAGMAQQKACDSVANRKAFRR
jgi:hypothetical protein